MNKLSVIIPALNEADTIGTLINNIAKSYPGIEIIVVDDGSIDETASIAEINGAKIVSHPYSMGNGAAIKSGARFATGGILIFMDADGQHKTDDISLLVDELDQGYDMVVGSRSFSSQAGLGRGIINVFYNKLASYMTNQKIMDLTSGFRAVRAEKFREFLYLFPNGFSYPTTCTMAFFRAGYSVAYMPITANKRKGKSHIHPIKDGIRFLLIIFKVGTLYSPLKLFMPFSFMFFATGLSYYLYTFLTMGRFTNMSALLISTSVIIFLIGLVSEQITQLMYRQTQDRFGGRE